MEKLMAVSTMRDDLMNLVLRVPATAGLNSPRPKPGVSLPSITLAADLKRLMSTIQVEAISDDGSQVDYQKIKTSQTYAQYRELADHLSGFDLEQLTTRAERLAFWINLYNSLVIDAVIQEEVKQSVTESWLGILGFFQKAAYWVDGVRYSLTDIEHGILRQNRGTPYIPGPQFSALDVRKASVIEPMDFRIHFALNCASASCPPIQFYDDPDLERQLDLATKNFVNQDLEVDVNNRKVYISKIFSWYQVDFGGNPGILSFVAKYINDPDLSDWIKENIEEIKISYKTYDWSLNRMS